jgi:hypothetical protein
MDPASAALLALCTPTIPYLVAMAEQRCDRLYDSSTGESNQYPY